MDKNYTPETIEDEIYALWEKENLFAPVESSKKFSIVMPPPNVTGSLHMGHALDQTLQDLIVRIKRMQGYQTLWVPGTDHAGIATQNVVEKAILKEGKTRYDLGREDFIKRVWKWKEQYGNRITKQIKKLGASTDWTYERFTMDEGLSEAVKQHFVRLYEKGLLYKGSYIINWCPRCKTALSDIEVTHKDVAGKFWTIKYAVEDTDQFISVSTTRPETMFGDTAIAVNPNDLRYQGLVGKQVIIPFTDKKIPIIVDEYVDAQFGTGAVKITPAHDFNDFEVGERHHLDKVIVLDESAKMNGEYPVPAKYEGLDRYICRSQLVEDLKEAGYLQEVKKHDHAVGHCYRCNTVVEPYISQQWFVAMKKVAEPALEAVRSGKIEFVPARFAKLYYEWMENIRDWCVSRQIWWGHRIPAWYCPNHADEPIVATEKPQSCPKCGHKELTQDNDVLDTWFSSALWPFGVFGWPEQTENLKQYYPTSVLVTGYDILTFWVSRMIVAALTLTDEIPFEKVYIHGLVRDADGKKMSKSIGNVIDPLHLIDEYGADVLRLALIMLNTLGGQDIKLAEDKFVFARNFSNKLWNVTRYVLGVMDQVDEKVDWDLKQESLSLSEQWILSCFYRTLKEVNKEIDKSNYSMAADILTSFIWNTYCDWYIEISKLDKKGSVKTLVFILINILKLLHPFMPFMTEYIWQDLLKHQKLDIKENYLITASWPQLKKDWINPELEELMKILISVTTEIRKQRKSLNIALGTYCDLQIVSQNEKKRKLIAENMHIMADLAKIKQVVVAEKVEKTGPMSSSVVDDIEIFISLSGIMDLAEEKKRLNKKLAELKKSLQMVDAKLNNAGFLQKAPADIVAIQKEKREQLRLEYNLLEQRLNLL